MSVQVLSRRSELLSPARVPHLTDIERAQVAELLARLEGECEADVRRVIVYGSKARGDAVPGSDVDLLIVAADDGPLISQVWVRYQREFETQLEVQIYSRQDWKNYRHFKFPFYVNVRRGGVELWDPAAQADEELQTTLDFPEGELRAMDYETIEMIRLEVRESREMWRNAQLIENDGRPLYALPLAYRCAFNLATAALFAVNVIRDKHSGVRDALSEFLVRPGLLETEYKDTYVRLYNARGYVEYGKAKGDTSKEISDTAAERLLRDAERFNDRINQFLRERGAMLD